MSELISGELGLGIIMVLAVYLYHRHQQRLRRRQADWDPEEWNGKAIDVTQLKPRLAALRREHLAARPLARSVGFHCALLHWARHTVVRLAYFRDRNTEPPTHTHLP